jgi:hypothetical protein
VPRNSIGRKVARAASIGGSRSYRQRTPLGWYAILIAICVVGLGLVVFSRHERQQMAANASTTTTTTQANTTAPTLSDHWQVALSVDVCGHVANLPRSADQSLGIVTAGNGVVDIEPARAGDRAAQYEGANATLGKFLSSEHASLTATSLTLPASLAKLAGTYDNGRKCGSKPGRVQVYIWPSPKAPSPFSATGSGGLDYANGEMFMLAFLPKGASVSRPTGQKLVEAFITPPATTTTTTTKPGSKTTTTTKPVSTTTTTTKPVSTTTTTG